MSTKSLPPTDVDIFPSPTLSSSPSFSVESSGQEDDGLASEPAEEDFVNELLSELDERDANDNEQIWAKYDEARSNETAATGADGSVDDSAGGATSPSAWRVATLVPSPHDLAPRHAPAIQLTPLTAAQLALANELDCLDQSGPTAAASNEIRWSAKFVLIHPLWVAQGKKLAEERAKGVAERLANPQLATATLEAELAAAAIATPPPVTVTAPSSSRGGRTSQGSVGSGGGSRSNSRSGPREDEKHGKKLSSTQELSPPVIPKERTFALGNALLDTRFKQTQEALQESRFIPLSKVSPIPLIPDSEHFHLVLERTQVSNALTTYDLTWNEQSVHIRCLRNAVSASLQTSYYLNGQRYYETFEEGSERDRVVGGVIHDSSKLDSKVFQLLLTALGRDLLTPLSLAPTRQGWIQFWEEFVDWKKCGVHLQLVRSICEPECVIQQLQQPSTKTRPSTTSAAVVP